MPSIIMLEEYIVCLLF